MIDKLVDLLLTKWFPFCLAALWLAGMMLVIQFVPEGFLRGIGIGLFCGLLYTTGYAEGRAKELNRHFEDEAAKFRRAFNEQADRLERELARERAMYQTGFRTRNRKGGGE